MCMYRKALSLFVMCIVLCSVLPTITQANDSEDIKTFYAVEIDNERKTVTVEATFEDVRENEIEFRFYQYGSYRYTDTPATFKILESSGSILEKGEDWWRMKVGGNGKIYVKYRINYDFAILENYDHPCGIDTNFGLFCAQDIFAIPAYNKELMGRKVKVTFDIPNNWDCVLTTYEKVNDTTFKEENLYELNRTIFEMGKVRFIQTGNFYGLDTTYTIFESPKDFKTDDPGLNQMCMLFPSWDLDFKKQSQMFMEEVAYFTNKLSEKFNIHTPNRINLAAATRSPWWGWWHYETPYRAAHTAHHQVCFYAGRTVSFSGGLFWGIVNYYDTLLAAEYTGEKRYLGQNYLRYLLYNRGLKERMKKHNDSYDYIVAYNYGPLVLLYLDEEIQDQTNGKKNLDDVYSYILDKYLYGDVNKNEFIKAIKFSTGIDFSKFFFDHVFGDYEIPIDNYVNQYKDDFELHLDFHRRNSGAPDIMYYAFIEISADKGNPEYDVNLQTTYLDIDDFYPQKDDFNNFVKDLKNIKYITKAEFIDYLNKYTNNNSNDFFEFYSQCCDRPPTIESLNYWLSSKYTTLVQKELYVKNAINKLNEMIPFSSDIYGELRNIKRQFTSYREVVLSDNFEEAENMIIDIICSIEDLRNMDGDDDLLPDAYELCHDLDPNTKKFYGEYRADFGIEIDGYTFDWDNIQKMTSSSNPYLKSIKLTSDEDYLYILGEYDLPPYETNNSIFDFYFFSINSDDRTQFSIGKTYSFFGSEMGNNGCEDYFYMGNDLFEFKIPKETLRIFGIDNEFRLLVQSRYFKDRNDYPTLADLELAYDLTNNSIIYSNDNNINNQDNNVNILPHSMFKGIEQEIKIIIEDTVMINYGKARMQVTYTNNTSILSSGFDIFHNGVNGDGDPQINAWIYPKKVNDHYELECILKPSTDEQVAYSIRSWNDEWGHDLFFNLVDPPEILENLDVCIAYIDDIPIICGEDSYDLKIAKEYVNIPLAMDNDTFIVLGGLVANPLASDVVFESRITNDYPGYGKGVIEVIEHEGNTYVLIAGSDREGTRKALEYFLALDTLPDAPITVE